MFSVRKPRQGTGHGVDLETLLIFVRLAGAFKMYVWLGNIMIAQMQTFSGLARNVDIYVKMKPYIFWQHHMQLLTSEYFLTLSIQ